MNRDEGQCQLSHTYDDLPKNHPERGHVGHAQQRLSVPKTTLPSSSGR